ncbi:prepilin-type N-terminal cleavage/methylation domain-containing protein [bacterium]|nr:prepilin-type N-terminal cleavage/methylation domain-containing protein [bacterium]
MKKTYEGFSLIEMLITMIIMSIIMVVVSSSLTTLVKVSLVSSAKMKLRNESEYVLELVRRTVRNSNPDDVYIYDSLGARVYDPKTGVVEGDEEKIPSVYSSANIVKPEGTLDAGDSAKTVGNEIHFRPYGYEEWICIGFFYDKGSVEGTNDYGIYADIDSGAKHGYILQTSVSGFEGGSHADCFDEKKNHSYNYIVLNSSTVGFNEFGISYIEESDGNYLISFNLTAEALKWYLGKGAPVQKIIKRQTVVQTEGFIW